MTELSPEARALFAVAREGYAASPQRLAKVGALVAMQVGATIPAASAAPASAAAAGKASTGSILGGLSVTKIVGAVAIVAAGAGIAVLARPTAPPPSTVPHETARASPSASASTGEPGSAAALVPSAATISGEAIGRTVPPPPGDPARGTDTARLPRTPRRAETLGVRAPDEKGIAAERLVLDEVEEPAPNEPARNEPAPHEPAPDVLAREVELVESARRALRSGDPARALSLTSEYAARYPRGTLSQEVRVVRALSLCQSGRVAEGRRIVAAIETASPRSPHLERLRQVCGRDAKP